MLHKRVFILLIIINLLILLSCTTTRTTKTNTTTDSKNPLESTQDINHTTSSQLKLLFAGDIMAHTVNYNITNYSKIWRDIVPIIQDADLAFANIESPIDTTKPSSSYPNFNMTQEYVQAAINAGFNVFSLANNHSFDQFENGIKQTIITAKNLAQYNPDIYFSGLKESKNQEITYNLITQNDWKILFIPVTEILNYPHNPEYINYIKPNQENQTAFINFCKNLKNQTQADLLILSLHANEPEYTRIVTQKQKDWYLRLLNEGQVDILWANHAHIIKDRLFVFDSSKHTEKLIMFANGNTISGQRLKPDFNSKEPQSERDNTGDGLLYSITLEKKDNNIKIKNAKPIFITTYINTAYEFVIKPLDYDFVNYLKENGRNNWAEYIKKRITINNQETKDLIIWQ